MQNKNNDFDFEVKRKMFHLCSIILPIIYFFVSKTFMVVFLLLLTVLIIYIDIARHYNYKIKYVVEKFCGKFIREQEQSGGFAVSGASFMIAGIFLCTLLFAKGLAINCMFVLIICDSLAALVGKKIGTNIPNSNKSVEGSVAFFVSAVFVSLLCYNFAPYPTNFSIIIINSLIATAGEFYSSRFNLNDNLIIPLSYGLSNVIFGLAL